MENVIIGLAALFVVATVIVLFSNKKKDTSNTNLTPTPPFIEPEPLPIKFEAKNFDFTKIVSNDKPPRILIAEDNMVNARILIKLLGKFGINEYIHVIDGLKAVEARKQSDEFDLILMDINMPIMTGDEATQAILKWEEETGKKHIPIIAVTANALIGDREKYLKEGMDNYTTKPLKVGEISTLINQYTGFKVPEL